MATKKAPAPETKTIVDLAKEYLRNAAEIRRLEKEKENMRAQLDQFLGGQETAEVQISAELRVCRTVSYTDRLDPELVREADLQLAERCTVQSRRTTIAIRLA